jgi:hypothetical protein
MAKTLLDRFVTRNGNIAKTLADRRMSALEVWRSLVMAAAAGKEIDVAELERAAVALRVTDVVEAFEHDRDNVKAVAAAQESFAREDAASKEAAARYAVAVRDIGEARMRVALLERDINALPAYAAAASFSQAEMRRLEDATPRIYARESLERRRIPTDPPVSETAIEEHATKFAPRRTPGDQTFWDTSDSPD